MVWDVSMSTRRLPGEIREYFSKRAGFLHGDLLYSRYRGGLVKLPYVTTWNKQRGRVTFERNPLWYSNFYWANTPHIVGKRGPRRVANYETVRRSRFERSLGFVADSKDRDFLRYDSFARELVLGTLMDGVEVEESEFGSLVDKVCFDMEVEPVNEVRRFFGEDDVVTYRGELDEFRRDYGDDGDAMFYAQFEDGGLSVGF